MSIGKKITQERKRLGLSQTDFANSAGVSLSSQRRYESGERQPDTAYLDAVGRLGVDVSWILFGVRQDEIVDCPYAKTMGLDVHGMQVKPITLIECQDHATGLQMRKNWQNEGIREGFKKWHEYCQACPLHPTKGSKAQADNLDVPLLALTLEQLETVSHESGLSLSTTKKAQAAAMLYRAFKANGKVDTKMVEEAIKLAAG